MSDIQISPSRSVGSQFKPQGEIPILLHVFVLSQFESSENLKHNITLSEWYNATVP